VTVEARFEADKDLIRKRLVKYTRRAFRMLPKLDKPHILDVGCGSGVPAMELARLSDGQIIGLDINQRLLDILATKIEKAGLSHRVKPLRCSMFDMDFPDESFDVIWAEGSISVIGFNRGLKEWRRFLKPDGFLVVHDEIGNTTEKLERVSSCGYDLLDYFTLLDDTWLTEYYAPLQKLVNKLRTEHSDDPKLLEILDHEQREIAMVKSNPGRYCSAFFIMKKR
jgi:ubiquinone/menaquinone biosynthesis C-methylase UbiE